MAKLFWAMIISGVGLIAYPFFVKPPKYDPSFSEAAIDALEYPNQVRVLVLQPANSKGDLQAYWPGVSVFREYSTPKGWATVLEPILKEAVKPGAMVNASGSPDYVIRYEGRSATLDLVWDKDSGAMWFQERGAIKPFFVKLVGDEYSLRAILRPVTLSQRN
ncbi:MAG: hypothetical protein IT206_02160 [Fimbriimonadaceae bacterium]|nr:hypothetical protein [Fimbriimonadaceae bacterium]